MKLRGMIDDFEPQPDIEIPFEAYELRVAIKLKSIESFNKAELMRVGGTFLHLMGEQVQILQGAFLCLDPTESDEELIFIGVARFTNVVAGDFMILSTIVSQLNCHVELFILQSYCSSIRIYKMREPWSLVHNSDAITVFSEFSFDSEPSIEKINRSVYSYISRQFRMLKRKVSNDLMEENIRKLFSIIS